MITDTNYVTLSTGEMLASNWLSWKVSVSFTPKGMAAPLLTLLVLHVFFYSI